jgi:hypothetical protein
LTLPRRTLVSLKKFALIALLSTSIATQAKEMLIRDVSWSGYTYFNPTSFYTLLDPIYVDKISLFEEESFDSNFLFSWLGGFVPRQWNINVANKKTTIWSYDALDALYVGIQGASSAITKASLDLLPISKAIMESGKTTDIRFNEVSIKGSFDLTQFITLNAQCMEAHINKARVNKALSLATAGAITLQTTKPTFISKVLPDGINLNIENLLNILPTRVRSNSYLLTIIPLVAAAGTQRIENFFLNEYVKNFELIMKSDKVIFDKKEAHTQITKLIKNVKSFGFGRKLAKRMEALI